MGRVSEGGWFQQARRVAEGMGRVPAGPRLTAALMADRESLSVAMARRLSSAYLYAKSKTDHTVIASLAVVEQIQTIERLDPSAIADLLDEALAGRTPLSALKARAASTRARLSATSSNIITPDDLVEACPELQEPRLGRDLVELDPQRDRGLVVVDAALYQIDPVEDANRVRMSVDARWCLIASPHIGCAVVKDPSHEKFVLRVLVAAALFARISVMCSSPYERNLIEAELRRPRLWTRVWVRQIEFDPARSK